MKRFAIGTSEGPNINNLQLNFWRLAVQKFGELQTKWRQYAVEDSEFRTPQYTRDDFAVDAAVAIVLAGTSIAELVGQNVAPDGNRTPYLKLAIRLLLGDSVPQGTDRFIQIYDALRHFGPAKHVAVSQITEDSLCDNLTTAQEIWCGVLRRLKMPETQDFRKQFIFKS